MGKESVIQKLGLESHIEGGYYRRTFESRDKFTPPGLREERFAATSIFYLLTDEQPVGHWHKNRSEILHFFQGGDALQYHLISPEGDYSTVMLGPDLKAGHQLQMLVPGGYWKASHLVRGEYGLISEVVIPGFDFADMQLATESDIRPLVSDKLWGAAKQFVRC